jgi:hypothetical protein
VPRLHCCVTVVVSLLSSVAIAQANPENLVLNRFPGYHVLTARELDSETKTYFLQHFPKSQPGMVIADFDGNGYFGLRAAAEERQIEDNERGCFVVCCR